MRINRERWLGTFLWLWFILHGLISTPSRAAPSLYHRDLKGEVIDLQQWHHEYQGRCLSPGAPPAASSKVGEIVKALDYLAREQIYAQHLLLRAKQAGVLICVDNRADGTRGYYDYNYNIIAVREGLPFMKKVVIILHELRHVEHVVRGYRLSLDYAMDEMVRLTFAVEADVQVYVALVAWHLRQSGDGGLWDALLGFARYADIAQVYGREMLAGATEHRAARAAFVQWYRSSWRRDNYHNGCCMGYLDMLDESNRVEQYTELPGSYLDQLCELPDGSNYGCHETQEIRARY